MESNGQGGTQGRPGTGWRHERGPKPLVVIHFKQNSVESNREVLAQGGGCGRYGPGFCDYFVFPQTATTLLVFFCSEDYGKLVST